MRTVRRTLIAAFGAALVAASSAEAQTYHLPSTPEKGVWAEASYADLEGLSISFPSTFWFVSGRLPLTSDLRAVADIPFAFSRIRFAEGSPRESSSVLGNPFLGVEYLRWGLVMETGLRVPLNTIDEGTTADLTGGLGDFQRGEAFSDDVVPVSGAVTYVYGLPGGATLQGRTGVVGLFTTDETDNDALIDYGVLGTYPVSAARFGLGLYGRWLATADEGSYGDNSVHHLALAGDVQIRRVRPGVSVRIPVDGRYNDVLHSTIGLYFQLPLQ